jgi:hypothetical protein
MKKQTWNPQASFFRPAPPGLSIEELEERARREHSANHGIALVMSNGPQPSEEAFALMQKYVDGEYTLEEVLAMTLKLHGIEAPSEPAAASLPEEPLRKDPIPSPENPDAEEIYWMEKLSNRPSRHTDSKKTGDADPTLPSLFDSAEK